MKKFLKPNLFKIISTIIILLISLGGNFIYSKSIIFTETGFMKPNLAIKIVNYIANIILYPVRLITKFFQKMFGINYIQYTATKEIPNESLLTDLPLLFIFLIFLIIESYLISCLISFLINKIKRGQV